MSEKEMLIATIAHLTKKVEELSQIIEEMKIDIVKLEENNK